MLKNDRLIQCCPGGSLLTDTADIEGFEKYLEKGRNKHTAAQRFSYAKGYAHVLQTGDAHELLTLPDEKRLHVMKSLAVLAKYYGIRDEWRRIKDNHGLKWTYDNNDLRTFQAITDGKNYETMIQELRTTIP